MVWSFDRHGEAPPIEAKSHLAAGAAEGVAAEHSHLG
jgi:hypothetical protein